MAGSINFAVLGKQDIASEFGKKGTSTDITIYDKKETGIIRTWVVPSGFPDKIQPLLTAINLSEYVVFHVDKLDRFAGEQIIALDALKKRRGIISHTFDVDEARLDSMIKGTVVEGYARVGQDGIRQAINGLGQAAGGGDTPAGGESSIIQVDHSFDVRGVGTVILGRVAAGTVRQYDTLRLFPGGGEILVKSIQMHDDPVSKSACPARVGLAVKGVRHDQVGRGDMIAADGGAVRVGTEIRMDFQRSAFYKGEITEGQGCMVNIGLQTRAARLAGVLPAAPAPAAAPIRAVFEKPVAYMPGEIAVILKPESQTTRIIGSGPISGSD